MNCVSHPRMPAARQCGQCQRAWCAACVKQLTVAGALLEVCAHCKGRLREPYQAPPPPSLEPRELVARAFSKEGLITAAAMSLPILLGSLFAWIPGMDWFGALMALIYYGTLVGYYFEIIAHIGDDKPGLPGPTDLRDDNWALVFMALRGLVCVVMGTLPYLVYVYALHDGGTPHDARISAILILAGLLYTPAIVVSIVVTSSTLGALWPVAWVKIIARAPKSYAQLVGLFFAAFAGFGLLELVGRVVSVPLVGDYFIALASSLIWMAQACLVGAFLRRHAEDFGYA